MRGGNLSDPFKKFIFQCGSKWSAEMVKKVAVRVANVVNSAD